MTRNERKRESHAVDSQKGERMKREKQRGGRMRPKRLVWEMKSGQ